MDEPRIVIAITKFIADYEWDKSLTAHSSISTTLRRPSGEYVHVGSVDAIEEFTNAARK